MMRICDKFKRAAKAGEFFALREWVFCCENQKRLINDMTEKDQNIFITDVTQISWNDYFKHYMVGIRNYVLKDSMASLSNARRKLNR